MIHSEQPKLPSNFEALARELHRQASERRQPINGSFEITERCNLSCRMCYVRQAPGDAQCRAKELSPTEWYELARQARDNGMVFLLLTGGEIFVRSDFFNLYIPLTQLGLFITLFTNGTLISDSVAARLSESPPSRVAITLYGASESTYKEITGNSKNFIRCCRGIEALLKHNISLDLRTVITKQNLGEVDTMRKMAQDWGLTISMGFHLTQRRDGVQSDVTNCRLSAVECIEVESADADSAINWAKEAERKSCISDNHNFDCSAGKASFAINSEGEMNSCIDLPLPAARPLEIGFEEAWKQVQHFVDSAPSMSSICRTCNAFPYCSRCPAWSFLETGTLTDPIQYLCDIAHERKKRVE